MKKSNLNLNQKIIFLITALSIVCVLLYFFISSPSVLTCWGKHQKIVIDGYPKLPRCYATYSDGGRVCSDGSQCESGVCILSYDDDQALRRQAMLNETFSGTCLASRLRDIVNQPYDNCPMSINNGKIKQISLCANF